MDISSFILYIPLIGIVLFLILFVMSARLYPGGSQVDTTSVGFSLIHNYWCDLMDDDSRNGAKNRAKKSATIAMIILCFALALFFFILPDHLSTVPFWDSLIRVCGVIGMLSALFIFTRFHNQMILISSIFGVICLIGVFYNLYFNSNWFQFGLGLFCMLLLILNNIIFYTKNGIHTLPWVQKISFLFVFIWIFSIYKLIIV